MKGGGYKAIVTAFEYNSGYIGHHWDQQLAVVHNYGGGLDIMCYSMYSYDTCGQTASMLT